jgi:chromosome segregation ATPase
MANIEEKVNKLMNYMEAIKVLLITLNDNLESTNDKIDKMERKINNLDEKIDDQVLNECKKMGSHIDFVEEVYDNVKHPLGYIVKKIKYLTVGGDSTEYTLTNINKKIENDEYIFDDEDDEYDYISEEEEVPSI